MQYLVGHDVYSSFPAYRQALKDFLKRPDAAEALVDNLMMQADLIDAYLDHYHPDPSTGPAVLEREAISSVVVTAHPKWGSPCFGLVLTDGRCETFSLNKLKPTPRPTSSSQPPAQTQGQRTRNAYEAFRNAAEPAIAAWIQRTPVPERCPITDIVLAPLADQRPPNRRHDADIPTVDHHQPSFRELVATFLEGESMTMEAVTLRRDQSLGVWEMADEALRARWVAHHDTGELRWVSLAGNRTLNRQDQLERSSS